MKILSAVSAAIVVQSASAFAPSIRGANAKLTVCEAEFSRRSILTKTTASLASIAAVGISSSSPAFAEVAAGTSLPDGAAQFKRLLNLQNDLTAVTKRVADNASEIDKKEWDNLSDFMKKVYKGGDDMKAFAKTGIYDPEKKKKAEEDVKLLQKLAQAGSGPIAKEDAAGLTIVLKKSSATLEDFFELLRDVPDEI